MKQNLFLNFILFVLFVSIGTVTFAQRYDIPTLYFKNGDTLQGERHAFIKDQIQFSKTIKAKPVKYDFEDIIKVEVVDRRSAEITTYAREAIVGKRKKVTLELLEEGFLSYYRIKNYAGMEGNYYFDFYLKRINEDAITYVGTDNPLKFDFKKKITAYLNDCNALVDKINAKEFKRKHLKEIVNYYNQNCVKKQ